MSNEATGAEETAENLDVIIGAVVHQMMWRSHEKQVDVAASLGVSQAALSLKLRGRRPWFASEIDKMARRYGVSRDVLFGEGEMPPAPNRGQKDYLGAGSVIDLAERRERRGLRSVVETASAS
jgi:hypothetical protein